MPQRDDPVGLGLLPAYLGQKHLLPEVRPQRAVQAQVELVLEAAQIAAEGGL